MRMKPLVLFDIDGTLVMTGGVGKRAVNRVFVELFGVEDAWDHYNPFGKTDPMIVQDIAMRCLQRSLSLEEVAEVFRRYVRYMEETIGDDQRFRVLPGVEEVLQRLQREEYPVGLATGNVRATAWLKMRRAGLERYFGCGGFGDDSPQRGELVARAIERAAKATGRAFAGHQVVLVGDAAQDIEAARTVGARAVAVATGRLAVDALQALRPDLVMESFAESEAFWRLLEAVV